MLFPVLRASLALLLAVTGQLVPCQERPGWLRCGDAGRCVAVTELCDGRPDCEAGEDEAEELCSGLACREGVRCESSPACLYTPHYQLCSPDRRTDCEDGSDEAHCEGRHYSGCFTTSSLGLRISDCSQCYCQIRDRTALHHNIYYADWPTMPAAYCLPTGPPARIPTCLPTVMPAGRC